MTTGGLLVVASTGILLNHKKSLGLVPDLAIARASVGALAGAAVKLRQ